MEYIGVSNDKEKIILLKTWGGPEVIELIKLEQSALNIKSENAKNDADEETHETSYLELVEKLRTMVSKMVNRTMAMYQLLTTQQGSRTWTDFIRDLERKAKTLNFERKPYTIHEAIKDAAIFGMNDTSNFNFLQLQVNVSFNAVKLSLVKIFVPAL